MSSQYGELPPISSWDQLASLWHPANFNNSRFGFLTAATSLNGANQAAHDVWPSPGLVHYIYIFGDSCPVTELYRVQHSLCVQVLHSPIIGSVTARHSSSGRQPNFVALSRRRHLYLAGWPSRWLLAHILVGHLFLCILQSTVIISYFLSTTARGIKDC